MEQNNITILPNQSSRTVQPLTEYKISSNNNNVILQNEIDLLLITALSDPGHRFFILKLDLEFCNFLHKEHLYLEFPPMPAFQRLLIHRVADYFKLLHETHTNNVITLTKKPESRIPLLRLPELYVEDQPIKNIKILTRKKPQIQIKQPEKKIIANPPVNIVKQPYKRAPRKPVIITSHPIEEKEEEEEIEIVDEKFTKREEDYAKARARIFNSDIQNSEDNISEEKKEVEVSTNINGEENKKIIIDNKEEDIKLKDSLSEKEIQKNTKVQQNFNENEIKSSQTEILDDCNIKNTKDNQSDTKINSTDKSSVKSISDPTILNKQSHPFVSSPPSDIHTIHPVTKRDSIAQNIGYTPNYSNQHSIPMQFFTPNINSQYENPQINYMNQRIAQEPTPIYPSYGIQNIPYQPTPTMINRVYTPFIPVHEQRRRMIARPTLYDYSKVLPGSPVIPENKLPKHILELKNIELDFTSPNSKKILFKIKELNGKIKFFGSPDKGLILVVFKSVTNAEEVLHYYTNCKLFTLHFWTGKIK